LIEGNDMKIYTGDRTIDGVKVLVDGHPLPNCSEIQCFSTMGFEWGYEGAEPRQLAFALLVDYSGSAETARQHCEPFMRIVVANFDNEWAMTSLDIEDHLDAINTSA
jgi:hypothetical protein